MIDMIYGTCVHVTIEFKGKIYYISAVNTDDKAHTSPNDTDFDRGKVEILWNGMYLYHQRTDNLNQ